MVPLWTPFPLIFWFTLHQWCWICFRSSSPSMFMSNLMGYDECKYVYCRSYCIFKIYFFMRRHPTKKWSWNFKNKRHFSMLLNAPVRWWNPWKMMDAKRFAHLCVWSVMELCRSDQTSKKLWHSWRAAWMLLEIFRLSTYLHVGIFAHRVGWYHQVPFLAVFGTCSIECCFHPSSQ